MTYSHFTISYFNAIDATRVALEAKGEKFTRELAMMLLERLYREATQTEVQETFAGMEEPAPRATKYKRPDNPLFNALAESCDRNLKEMTQSLSQTVAVAMRQIKAVCDDVTPDEIRRRVATYKRKHPTWELTEMSIAKHWASLGPKRVEKTVDPTKEPKNWRAAFSKLHPNVEIEDRSWASLSVHIRKDVARLCCA